MHIQYAPTTRPWQNLTCQVENINQCVILGMDNFFMAYHKDAVNNKRESVKIDDSHSVYISGKEQRRMFATYLDKIIFNTSNM